MNADESEQFLLGYMTAMVECVRRDLERLVEELERDGKEQKLPNRN